ncbi:MAG TPA: methyltransferase domain-containing protein [Candidatus Dormibacteraeota bacterium]|nr:methyltransferase domain-containing protein [Candidatus Dormibacteraeota bacterium]
MDRRTADAYERGAARWIARRGPSAIGDGRLAAFLGQVPRGGRVADLGCGPGWYAAAIRRSGRRVVAVDLNAAMLAATGRRAARVARVRGDLATLPLAHQSLDGAWAMNCYCHLPRRHLALALADLHAALRVGAPLAMTLPRLDAVRASAAARRDGECERRFATYSLRGRLFTAVTPARATALLVGAGFTAVRARPLPDDFWLELTARRARTLPDFVRPGLRLLICGLNPSLYSADAGLPFARLGNRFWPAATAAGLVTRPRDVRAALRRGVGFTDLVKRASAGAGALSAREYARGVERIATLARLYRPRAICFVGLDGWRAAVDRRAQPGWIAGGFAGVDAYLMPSTSGRNAAASLPVLVEHLRRARTGNPSVESV